MGDTGAAGPCAASAPNRRELLAKLLRLDVDGDDFPGDPSRHYRIPPSNPFATSADARPEIWAFGLRNPWGCSFDRQTGDSTSATSARTCSKRSTCNRRPARAGETYGWRLKEGNHATGLDPVGAQRFLDPIHEYSHDNGLAVIGGYVYRVSKIPDLGGTYFFADHNGRVWSLRVDGTQVSEFTERTAELFPGGGPEGIASFGEDAAG